MRPIAPRRGTSLKFVRRSLIYGFNSEAEVERARMRTRAFESTPLLGKASYAAHSPA